MPYNVALMQISSSEQQLMPDKADLNHIPKINEEQPPEMWLHKVICK